MRRLLLPFAAVPFAIAPAQARWIVAESANFRVYSEGPEPALRGLVSDLEDYDRLLRLITGTHAPPGANRLTVFITNSSDGLRYGRVLPSAVVGFYDAGENATYAYSDRSDEYLMNGHDILLHEYAHHFMLQYHPAAYPGWYVEGFAEYMMTARFTAKTIEYGHANRGRTAELSASDSWIPFGVLLDDRKIRNGVYGPFYPESWLLVHYLYRTPGRLRQLQHYLTLLQERTPEANAFEQAFHESHGDLQVEAMRYYAGSLTYTTAERPADWPLATITVRTLALAEGDMLLPHAALMLGPDTSLRAGLLARIRKRAGAYPDDPLARNTLAEAEGLLGDHAKGAAMLDEALKLHPDDAELLTVRGRVAALGTTPEALKEARGFYTRAHAADPAYYPALYNYGLAMLGPDGKASDNTINVLLLAHQLAPQVDAIAVNGGIALMRGGRYDEAIGLLGPVAADPHGDKATKYAIDLIDLAKAHKPPDRNFWTRDQDKKAADRSVRRISASRCRRAGPG